jgi:hypothetical protein
MTAFADQAYLAVKPQVAAATPIIPTNFIPLISENIRLNPNFTADRRMKGLSWESDELLKGPKQWEGELEIYADPDSFGHFLNMSLLKGTTTGDAANGYTHPFTVGDGDYYSLDIPRGIYAERLWGVRGNNLKISFEDNKMKATIGIKAMGKFYTASLAVALTGVGMTSAVFSTDSGLRPADGLCVGDHILIGAVDLAILTVNANGTTVTFASTTVTAAIGDPVHLKAQTPSFTNLQEPFYFGETLVGMAATTAAADTAAGSRATATACYEIGFEIDNDLLASPASGYGGPAALLNQVRSASLELSRLFVDPTQYQKWIENVKQAVTIISTGRYIKTDLTTSELLTIKMNKTKLMTHEEPLEVGNYIYDKQKFKVLYDSGDGAALTITLVNRTAATSY